MLASIQRVDKVYKHPNASRLSIVEINNYRCITGLDTFQPNDLCVLIQPDSVLPDQDWAIPYKKFAPNRIKAQKIRGEWSFGLALPINDIGMMLDEYYVGLDVTNVLGITKYVNLELENNLDARRCGLPYSIVKTDETIYLGIQNLQQYFGKRVDISVKVDGQSCTIYYKDGDFGICSRTNDYKLDRQNAFTAHNERYNLQEKLTKFCVDNKVNLALRGESYGPKIQGFKHNPWSKKPHGLALFSVWNIDAMHYERLDSPYYIHKLAPQLGLPTVPILEKDVLFRNEHITKYKNADTINYGEGDVSFEGVVVQSNFGSFKIINMEYDSKK